MPTGKTLLYVNESSLDPSNFYVSKLIASIGSRLKEPGRLFPSKTRYLTSAVSCKSASVPRTQRPSERHKIRNVRRVEKAPR